MRFYIRLLFQLHFGNQDLSTAGVTTSLLPRARRCANSHRPVAITSWIDVASTGAVRGSMPLPFIPVVQAKLRIGAPNDKYAQEVDRVANDVVRMPDPTQTTVAIMESSRLFRRNVRNAPKATCVANAPRKRESCKENHWRHRSLR
jgi:hypothetical protein